MTEHHVSGDGSTRRSGPGHLVDQGVRGLVSGTTGSRRPPPTGRKSSCVASLGGGDWAPRHCSPVPAPMTPHSIRLWPGLCGRGCARAAGGHASSRRSQRKPPFSPSPTRPSARHQGGRRCRVRPRHDPRTLASCPSGIVGVKERTPRNRPTQHGRTGLALYSGDARSRTLLAPGHGRHGFISVIAPPGSQGSFESAPSVLGYRLRRKDPTLPVAPLCNAMRPPGWG